MCVYVYTHTRTRERTRARAHTRTRTRTHTHTHTHTRSPYYYTLNMRISQRRDRNIKFDKKIIAACIICNCKFVQYLL